MKLHSSPHSVVAAVTWAFAFVTGMLAVPPPHHTWAWLCLVPFCWHFWHTLGFIQAVIQARVRGKE